MKYDVLVLATIAAALCRAQEADSYENSSSSDGSSEELANYEPSYARKSTLEPAGKDQFPYLISVNAGHSSDVWTCGGAIISPTFALTSASCMTSKPHTDSDDSADSSPFQDQSAVHQRIEPEKVILHPNFDSRTLVNDIALLRIRRGTLSNKAIKLPRAGESPQGYGVALGRNQLYGDRTKTLIKAKRLIGLSEHCKSSFSQFDDRTHFCGIYTGTGEVYSCFIEPGGPFIKEKAKPPFTTPAILLGIISHGSTACDSQATIFTKVSAYLDFIEEHVKDL